MRTIAWYLFKLYGGVEGSGDPAAGVVEEGLASEVGGGIAGSPERGVGVHRDSAARVPPVGEGLERPREREGRLVYSDAHLVVMRTARPMRAKPASGERHPARRVLTPLVAARAAGRRPTESELEDDLLAVIRRYGLPEPVPQYPYRGRRIDFAYPELETVLKVTGWADLPGLELYSCAGEA